MEVEEESSVVIEQKGNLQSGEPPHTSSSDLLDSQQIQPEHQSEQLQQNESIGDKFLAKPRGRPRKVQSDTPHLNQAIDAIENSQQNINNFKQVESKKNGIIKISQPKGTSANKPAIKSPSATPILKISTAESKKNIEQARTRVRQNIQSSAQSSSSGNGSGHAAQIVKEISKFEIEDKGNKTGSKSSKSTKVIEQSVQQAQQQQSQVGANVQKKKSGKEIESTNKNGKINEEEPIGNKCTHFRSDAPDLLIALVDETISFDPLSLLRNSFAGKIIQLVDPAQIAQVKDVKSVQMYLPFKQEKIYKEMDTLKLVTQSSESERMEVEVSKGDGDSDEDEDIFEQFYTYLELQQEKKDILNCDTISKEKQEQLLGDLMFRKSVDIHDVVAESKALKVPQEQLAALTSTKVNSIDVVRSRAVDNKYYRVEELDRDMRKLFSFVLLFRCKSLTAFQYVTKVIRNYNSLLMKSKYSESEFSRIKLQDLSKLVKGDLEHKMQVKKWPLIPTSYRDYVQITEYDCQPPSMQSEIQEKLTSKKVAKKCSKKCVCNQTFPKLGMFDLETCTWDSKCENRRNRIECSECNETECNNQQVSKHNRKIVGTDVEEIQSWGVDLYTKKNIFHLLPESYNDNEKNCFIQYQLMKAINLQKENGWDIVHSCEFILKNSVSKLQRLSEEESKEGNKDPEPAKKQMVVQTAFTFNEDTRKCAKSLLKAIQFVGSAHFLSCVNVEDKQLFNEAFRVHTKGIGLICINPAGIQQNEFITEYIGEIYQPWRWFEKQDIIKNYLKKTDQKDILPDFWNIMLEIHKDDPKGYDILFVDPILKGNFSSRLSHSCEPNCGTVPSVTNAGKYVIGMYAMHPIDYGEELSFDYMAVTESIQEHKRAVCLCGSGKCRGRYLELSNSNIRQFNSILERIHCFLHRTDTLQKACTLPLSTEDEAILEKDSFRSNILNGCPDWLKKWCALILQVINVEHTLFYEELVKTEKKQLAESQLPASQLDTAFLKCQALARRDARIQNLVISIDKVKYYIRSINDMSPPLSAYLTAEELMKKYWTSKDNTLKEDMCEVLQSIKRKIKSNPQMAQDAIDFVSRVGAQIDGYSSRGEHSKGVIAVRAVLLAVSELVLKMKSHCSMHMDGIALMMHFHAFTHRFFETHSYMKFVSEEQKIMKDDIINVELFDKELKKKNAAEMEADEKKDGDDEDEDEEDDSAADRKKTKKKKRKFSKKTPLLNEEDFAESKVYTSLFVWGQLNCWYKQSVTNPATTLSNERRGPLVYPYLASSFMDSANPIPFTENRKAGDSGLDEFCNHVKAKPENCWAQDNTTRWSFKNQMNIYGSFLFEGRHFQRRIPNYVEDVIDWFSSDFKTKVASFVQVESFFDSSQSKNEIQTIVNDIMSKLPSKKSKSAGNTKSQGTTNVKATTTNTNASSSSSLSQSLNVVESEEKKKKVSVTTRKSQREEVLIVNRSPEKKKKIKPNTYQSGVQNENVMISPTISTQISITKTDKAFSPTPPTQQNEGNLNNNVQNNRNETGQDGEGDIGEMSCQGQFQSRLVIEEISPGPAQNRSYSSHEMNDMEHEMEDIGSRRQENPEGDQDRYDSQIQSPMRQSWQAEMQNNYNEQYQMHEMSGNNMNGNGMENYDRLQQNESDMNEDVNQRDDLSNFRQDIEGDHQELQSLEQSSNQLIDPLAALPRRHSIQNNIQDHNDNLNMQEVDQCEHNSQESIDFLATGSQTNIAQQIE